MHMADALLSPTVGGGLWAAAATVIAYSARKVRSDLDDRRIPLMGVLGAFIFAAQMINFAIPGTGSSGHLGGGMILAILLGPHPAFLTMASVLTAQALFFADGGLLALGCNIVNLGFFTCFVAYPLVFRPLAGAEPTALRLLVAALLAAVVGLQLGAFGVVVETSASGIAALPFATFALLMQPIHLAIGVVEGLITAAVVTFVWKARPEVLVTTRPLGTVSLRQIIVALLVVSLIVAGCFSWFASSRPDGLEWAIAKVSGERELAAPAGVFHQTAGSLQTQTAILPDYNLKGEAGGAAGTSLAGVLGSLATLVLLGLVGVGLTWHRRRWRDPG
jgi:cobalt/nickel transport system permease protein